MGGSGQDRDVAGTDMKCGLLLAARALTSSVLDTYGDGTDLSVCYRLQGHSPQVCLLQVETYELLIGLNSMQINVTQPLREKQRLLQPAYIRQDAHL